MQLSKNIKGSIVKSGLLVAVWAFAAFAANAQIRIGEIEINALKCRKSTPDESLAENVQRAESEIKTEEANADEPPEWWLKVIVGDIEQAKVEVDSYTPATKMYLVSSASAPWLLRAVSAKAREEFALDKKLNDWRKASAGNPFDTALDALAESAAKKLPGYAPNANFFAHRDAALELSMKSKLKNPASLKILRTGLFQANWIIEKNDGGLPANRYREAFILAKDSSDDHNYCHLYGFVVQQDYAGGGTYGATYVYLNTDALFGCPTK